MKAANSFWQKRLFWGIKSWELIAYLGMYLLLGTLYFSVLLLTVSQNQLGGVSLNYGYKIIVTAPFWWLFFRKLRHWPLSKKLLLHLPLSVVYVAMWLGLFYATLDLFNLPHLQGAGIWWDAYIPLLGYFIQFGIFHAYFYWNETVRQQQKEKSLMKLAHTAELNTLKAQIQPHFLFNTLNSINSSLPASEEKSRMLIAQLADVFRFAMNVTDKELVSLQNELAFIQNYLALEQHRFGDRLQIEYQIDQQLQDYQLPPMLLQPLVENALKHGIAKSVDGGRVTISIAKENDAVRFTISDTGNGINGTPVEKLFQQGIGLENTRQRLLRLYNTRLQISASQPKGFAIYFILPLQKTPGWN